MLTYNMGTAESGHLSQILHCPDAREFLDSSQYPGCLVCQCNAVGSSATFSPQLDVIPTLLAGLQHS